MANQIFELKDAYFSYLGKYPALCGININIEQGQMLAIIGANGTGKSTLLHMLDALIFPDKGSIRAFGKQINQDIFDDEKFSKSFRSKVGLVFQDPDVQLFCPTVIEDIVFGPLQLGTPKEEVKKRTDELLEILNIKDLAERSPHQLSVGEKKKVSIASVLAINPDVLLLDEPTAGLDPNTCRELIDLIQDFHTHGKTIITATHDLHIVSEIADKVYILNCEKGIAAYGSSEEILTNEELLARHNLLHIHKHRHTDKVHIHEHQHLEHHRDKTEG